MANVTITLTVSTAMAARVVAACRHSVAVTLPGGVDPGDAGYVKLVIVEYLRRITRAYEQQLAVTPVNDVIPGGTITDVTVT